MYSVCKECYLNGRSNLPFAKIATLFHSTVRNKLFRTIQEGENSVLCRENVKHESVLCFNFVYIL